MTGRPSRRISKTRWRSCAGRESRHERRGPSEARSRRASASGWSHGGDADNVRDTAMKVSVFGLGYVGSVSAASFAADGHTVVGVDVNPDKVASLNEGRSPIVEKGLDETHSRRHRRMDRCEPRPPPSEAVHATDIVAPLRRHTEPQERQPRSVVSRTRLRADRFGAETQGRLPRRRGAQHGAAGHDARSGHPDARAGIGQEVRDRLRRDRQPGVPARRHRDCRFPAARR